MQNWLHHRLGIDHAIAFAILARGWGSIAGLITVALIARFLKRAARLLLYVRQPYRAANRLRTRLFIRQTADGQQLAVWILHLSTLQSGSFCLQGCRRSRSNGHVAQPGQCTALGSRLLDQHQGGSIRGTDYRPGNGLAARYLYFPQISESMA